MSSHLFVCDVPTGTKWTTNVNDRETKVWVPEFYRLLNQLPGCEFGHHSWTGTDTSISSTADTGHESLPSAKEQNNTSFKHQWRLFTVYIWVKCQSRSLSPMRKCRPAISGCVTVVSEISFFLTFTAKRYYIHLYEYTLTGNCSRLDWSSSYYVDPMWMFYLVLHSSSKLGV